MTTVQPPNQGPQDIPQAEVSLPNISPDIHGQERSRAFWIALILVTSFVLFIGLTLSMRLFTTWITSDDVVKLLGVVGGLMGGLVGAVIGYYFRTIQENTAG